MGRAADHGFGAPVAATPAGALFGLALRHVARLVTENGPVVAAAARLSRAAARGFSSPCPLRAACALPAASSGGLHDGELAGVVVGFVLPGVGSHGQVGGQHPGAYVSGMAFRLLAGAWAAGLRPAAPI